MSRKSQQSLKEPSPQETKSKAPKRTASREIVPKEISAAERLANELVKIPINEVAKIAAILSRKSFSTTDSVGKAYELLETCVMARNGIRKGYGHRSELGGDRDFLFTRGPSNLRWQNLKTAFPQISTHPDEHPYIVPFYEGLAKLMGKNTKIAERPEIFRRFLEQERHPFAGNRYLSQEEVNSWVEFFKRNGFPSTEYIDFWFFYPLWRPTDISEQKSKNAQKVKREARPPKTDAVDRSNLALLKYAAYDRENA